MAVFPTVDHADKEERFAPHPRHGGLFRTAIFTVALGVCQSLVGRVKCELVVDREDVHMAQEGEAQDWNSGRNL